MADSSEQHHVLNQNHVEEIRKEQELLLTPVGAVTPLRVLRDLDFATHSGFRRSISHLLDKDGGDCEADTSTSSTCSFRRIRADGNCFYRAVMFGLLEYLANNRDESTRITETISACRLDTLNLGYSPAVVDDFYEEFVDAVGKVKDAATDSGVLVVEQLFNETINPLVDKYFVMLARILTSTYVKTHQELFLPFLETYASSCDEFCREEIDPMWREAEQHQIIALTAALNIGVEVVYLMPDQISPSRHLFPSEIVETSGFGANSEKRKIILSLLYRPGHFDIVYLN